MKESKFRLYELVKYKNEFIRYQIVGKQYNEEHRGHEYSIVRIDKEAKFLMDKQRTIGEIIQFGFGIKYNIKEEYLR